MSVINDSKEYFYLGLQNKKEQIDLLWPGVENLESTQFYELCQKYSDIALNAIKQRVPGTCDVQGCFQFADIEIAKRATKDYVVDREIEDVDTLLSAAPAGEGRDPRASDALRSDRCLHR